MGRRALPVDQVQAEGLACECPSQQPVRRLVDYGATRLSLLFCDSCGGLIVETRQPDELAVMRQDIEALRRIAADLFEQLGRPRAEPALGGGEPVRPSRLGPLRVLPGGLPSDPRRERSR